MEEQKKIIENENSIDYLLKIQNLRILDMKQASIYLRIPLHTLYKWTASGYRNIPSKKLGKKIIFVREELDEWIKKLNYSYKM